MMIIHVSPLFQANFLIYLIDFHIQESDDDQQTSLPLTTRQHPRASAAVQRRQESVHNSGTHSPGEREV